MSTRTAPRLVVFAIASFIACSTFTTGAQEVLGQTGISGAGSTFVYPVLSRWSRDYRDYLARGDQFAPNAGLDEPQASSALSYEPVGSLAGLLRLKDRAVDFAASEMPLKSDELSTLGLAQFPILIGGISVVLNIDGIGRGEVRLTGPLLADVFLGKITRWSDSAITSLNPTLRLPDAAIVVVHRSEGSGTTFNFTNYLSQVSPEWSLRVGAALLVPWPTGTGAKGNEGVAQAVRRTRNSIGYVEYSQASTLSDVVVQNRSGRFVRPEPQSFQVAAASADWAKTSDFYLLLTDAQGENAYPIAATVFVQIHKSAARRRTGAVLDFFRWSFASGSRTASQLGYVPPTGALIKQVEGYWAKAFQAGG